MSVTSKTELLRLVTCGSVDDGKSTLIGRLLFDTKQIFVDQMEHIEETSLRRGDGYVNLALLTDGLRAEREQGITIDVAFRSFVTPRRRFQLADAPGHVQYTRNMVTGASTADVAVILLDARQGVVEQTRRHAYIASILEIPHVVFAVNKMDLVDFAQERFDEIVIELEDLNARLATLTPAYLSQLSTFSVRQDEWFHADKITFSGQHAKQFLQKIIHDIEDAIHDQRDTTDPELPLPCPLVVILDGLQNFFVNQNTEGYSIHDLVMDCRKFGALVVFTSALESEPLGDLDYLADLVLRLEYRHTDSVEDRPVRILLLRKTRLQISRPMGCRRRRQTHALPV